MKKFIVISICIILSFNMYGQITAYEAYKKSIGEEIVTEKVIKKPLWKVMLKPEFMSGSIGYAHSIIHQSNCDGYNFNNINELYLDFLCIEMSFYWDNKTYNRYLNYDNVEWINDKSYIYTKETNTQRGFHGMKFGYRGKYMSLGFVISYGAWKSYCKTENYNLYYINQHYQDWEVGTKYPKQSYEKFGGGFYVKFHYAFYDSTKWVGIEPFVSIQATTNQNSFISVGVSFRINGEH